MRFYKKLDKKVAMILIVGAFFLSFLSIFELDLDYIDLEVKNDPFPKSSSFWEISSISITSNNNWAVTNFTYDWCNGAGTLDDPYVIENVTIDGLGGGYGIIISDSNVYFKIRNCTLINSTASGVGTGIGLGNVTNGFLIDNNCSFNARGISMQGSHNITISGNKILNNTSVGIWTDLLSNIYPTYNNTIIGNDIFKNNYGLFLVKTNDTIIKNNNIINSTATGIDLRESNNTKIIGNNCSFSDYYGIKIDAKSHNTQIIDNNCLNNSYAGIYLSGSENCSIIGNILNNNGLSKLGDHSGLNIYDGIGYNIINNTCNYNFFSGIKIYGNENNAINNTCIGNDYGIHISGDLNNISKNVCNNNLEFGIYIAAASANNSVTWNTVLGNEDCIGDYGTGTIINNNIHDCGDPGTSNGGSTTPEIPGYDLITMVSLIGIFSLFLIRQLTRKTKISQN